MEKLVRVVLRGKTVVQQYGVKLLLLLLLLRVFYPNSDKRLMVVIIIIIIIIVVVVISSGTRCWTQSGRRLVLEDTPVARRERHVR